MRRPCREYPAGRGHACGGDFEKGDLVRIMSPEGQNLGVGRVAYSCEEAARVIGQHDCKPLVHYDYLYWNKPVLPDTGMGLVCSVPDVEPCRVKINKNNNKTMDLTSLFERARAAGRELLQLPVERWMNTACGSG